MSRDFTKTITNGLGLGVGGINALVSGASAITIACWAQFDSFNTAATNNRIVCEFSNITNSSLLLNVGNATPVFRVNARSLSADGLQAQAGTTTITTGVWWHLCGVINFGAGTIQPYVNGVAEGGGAATFGSATYAPGSPTGQAAIGAPWNASGPISTLDQVDGRIAEVAIWRAVLTAGEIMGMARGATPNRARPGSLVFYMPLGGVASPERNRVGSGPAGTIIGTVPQADHPPISAPLGSNEDWSPYVVAAAGVSINAAGLLVSVDFGGESETITAGQAGQLVGGATGGSSSTLSTSFAGMVIDAAIGAGSAAVAYTDTFTDAAGTALTAHSPDAGGSWSVPAGTSGVISAAGRLRFGASGSATVLHIHSFTPGTADYPVAVDIYPVTVGTSYAAGVVGRYDAGTDSGYLLRYAHGSTAIQLLRKTSGTFSGVLASYGYTATAGVSFRVELAMTGSTIVGKLDGVQVLSYSDATPIAGAGKAGVGMAGTGTITDAFGLHLDNFRGVTADAGVSLDVPGLPIAADFGGEAETVAASFAGLLISTSSGTGSFDTGGVVSVSMAGLEISVGPGEAAATYTTFTPDQPDPFVATSYAAEYAGGPLIPGGANGGLERPSNNAPVRLHLDDDRIVDVVLIEAEVGEDDIWDNIVWYQYLTPSTSLFGTINASVDPFAATARYRGE